LATVAKYKTQVINAQTFAPELAVIQAHPALFAKLIAYPSPAAIPPALINQAIAAAGGGAKGLGVLTTATHAELAELEAAPSRPAPRP
jgi:hypothetical protein